MSKSKSIQSIERQERLDRRNQLKIKTDTSNTYKERKYTDSFLFKLHRRQYFAKFK